MFCVIVFILPMTAGGVKLTLTRTVPTAFSLFASWHADSRSKHQSRKETDYKE